MKGNMDRESTQECNITSSDTYADNACRWSSSGLSGASSLRKTCNAAVVFRASRHSKYFCFAIRNFASYLTVRI